ncbi:ABC-2 type transport system permease protein [Natronobacillus azotifigens]|uniref:ABC transporter permease subunit n=1 Tax=Natronobacillus azotifigens TaxID=472978 RepID=A0A9J6RBY1_9BACI|nr:ABC transporter permease subunit [Natronobacillus azotifigens]MCZ0702843.1 ABC transporter permease subunit [Natronobacillus azotifigens]
MKQFMTIMRKEFLEYWRNFSWIWVPVVFIFLSIMDPLTTYYMPIILDSVGGLPEGAVFEIPELPAPEVLMMSLSEISMFGVLIIILLTMGTIAGERKSGIAELVLVKPVKYPIYITAKWLAKIKLFLTAFIIGMLVSWYYVNLLFDTIPFTDWLLTVIFYSFWLVFVVSLTIFYSTLLKNPGLVAAVSVGTLIGMSIINSIFSHHLTWFPNSLSSHILELHKSGSIPSELWGTAFVTIVLSIGLLFLSFFTFQKKELA